MERIMAHDIFFDGRHYHMHVIELDDSGHVRIYPYSGEIHSTRFINGRVTVTVAGNPPRLCVLPCV